MKQIQYVMTNRKGEVKTFQFACMQNDTEAENLEAYRPDNLRGYAQQRLGAYTRLGYSLSNWHVIEPTPKP